MKSWRTITAVALAGTVSAPVLSFAAQQGGSLSGLASPSTPRVAAAPSSPDSPGSGGASNCASNFALRTTFPLVMCVERTNTSGSMGMFESNAFPWTNADAVFQSYRNQYLYPSAAVVKVAQRAVTIESLHSRGVSWSPILVTPILYNDPAPQYVRVYRTTTSALSLTFDDNVMNLSPDYLDWNGVKTIGQISGTAMGGTNPSGNALSDFISRPGTPQQRNDLDSPFNFDTAMPGGVDPATTNILVDTLMRLGGVQDVNNLPLWDITLDEMGQGCTEPQRVYGGGLFQNSNPLTTALQIDQKAFVWVFRGKTLPPPATIQQQIAEIIRLLVTPEGLRCTGLDLTPNGRAEDNPLSFPEGKDWDPIPPTVTNGQPQTGEEAGDGEDRLQGWIE